MNPLNGIKKQVEKKRYSKNPLWRALVWTKDFIWFKTSKARNNYVVVCDSKNFMFVCVFKNASSSLRRLAYGSDNLKLEERKKMISIKQSRNKKYKNYVKFAVYRDPVERFISFYKNKVLNYDEWFLKKYKDKKEQIRNLETFIEFAKKEIGNKMTCDFHLMPQHLFYKPRDIDYIVPIEKLDLFVKDKLNCAPTLRANATVSQKIKVSAKEIDEIKKIYADDYKIKPNY
jgi:hypothetical protein